MNLYSFCSTDSIFIQQIPEYEAGRLTLKKRQNASVRSSVISIFCVSFFISDMPLNSDHGRKLMLSLDLQCITIWCKLVNSQFLVLWNNYVQERLQDHLWFSRANPVKPEKAGLFQSKSSKCTKVCIFCVPHQTTYLSGLSTTLGPKEAFQERIDKMRRSRLTIGRPVSEFIQISKFSRE